MMEVTYGAAEHGFGIDFDILPWTLTIFFLVLFPTTQREAYSWNIPTT